MQENDINPPKNPIHFSDPTDRESTKDTKADLALAVKSFVRPGSVVVVITFFMFIVIADGNWGGFTIKEGYYQMIEAVVTTVIVAFFGMRGIEKTAREWQQNDYRYQRRYENKPRSRPHDFNDYQEHE